MKLLYLILFISAFFIISCEFSDSYSCSGFVYDIDTNEPLNRANVFISADGYSESEVVYTDKKGKFFVYADSVGYIWPFMSPAKEILVIAFKPGYNKIELEHADSLDFYLKKNPEYTKIL